jgi:hypothetical protein
VFTELVVAVVNDCIVGGSGARVHNPPVAVNRVSVRTMVSWRVLVTLLSAKRAVKPWAQSYAMDRRELDAMLGKMCTWRNERGRPGIRRLPV